MSKKQRTHDDCRLAAHWYLEHGQFSVIPVTLTPKEPPLTGFNKKPLLPSWLPYTSALPSHALIDSWWSSYPSACVGIVTGRISGITVADFDKPDNFDWYVSLVSNTISGGRHHLFAYDPHIRQTTHKDIGFDIRNDGGFIVAPPSFCQVDTLQFSYSWDELTPPTRANLRLRVPFPEELKDLLSQKQSVRKISLEELEKTIGKGLGRHDRLMSVVGTVINRLPRELLSTVGWYGTLAYNNRYCDPPKSEDEIKRMFEYALSHMRDYKSKHPYGWRIH